MVRAMQKVDQNVESEYKSYHQFLLLAFVCVSDLEQYQRVDDTEKLVRSESDVPGKIKISEIFKK